MPYSTPTNTRSNLPPFSISSQSRNSYKNNTVSSVKHQGTKKEMQGGVRLGVPGAEWIATVETMDAEVCVKAAAKFERRSTAEEVEERVVGVAKGAYEEFKQRMWPSRQRETMGKVE